jgi:hypothetical protein
VESIRRNPARAAGGIAAELALGAGRAAGALGRRAVDRRRTPGADEVDPEDLTSESVRSGEERFPGFSDPDTAREDPASALVDQVEEFTPEEIEQLLDRRAGEREADEADLVKALENQIEDPEGGDAFGVPEDATEEFESPGVFFGPTKGQSRSQPRCSSIGIV